MKVRKILDTTAFVLLVGKDGVGRWIGAETQVALSRYFGPHDDAERLPIFPILLDGKQSEDLPAFLKLFQAMPWNGSDPLPDSLFAQIRNRSIACDETVRFEGCPFVGLDAYRPDQSHLFFGRQKETLDALKCFDRRRGSPTVRWLEIYGNSGSGKSSLMNAGILPLVAKGWLFPRTKIANWHCIGPMMPGTTPITELSRTLARSFGSRTADVRPYIGADDDRALADWLSDCLPPDNPHDTAFLLAIDQFEEFFTVADPDERRRFDRLLAAALQDPGCPLFVISTVRADFFDRFEELPDLANVQNRVGHKWTLTPIGAEGLREVITRPALLAGLDVSEVKELIVAEARGEPGALPLVENALRWLWDERIGNRLVGQKYSEQGGLAGILSGVADDLLNGFDAEQQELVKKLLFRLVKLDPESRRHTRRRIPLDQAVGIAGGGDEGLAILNRLAGARDPSDVTPSAGALRLISVTTEATSEDQNAAKRQWVTLIHETLIRCQPAGEGEMPQPYWPTLYDYIEANRAQALRRDHALARAPIIEAAAKAWHEAGRNSERWTEGQFLRALTEIVEGGIPPNDVIRSGVSRDFFGPIDPQEIIEMLGLTEADDATKGSGRYGPIWNLPLGHERRAALADRLAAVGDPRPKVGLDADGLPLFDWLQIEDGTVEIEGNTVDVARFSMARYPVTIAQFKPFLDACFPDGVWQPPFTFTGAMPEKGPVNRR